MKKVFILLLLILVLQVSIVHAEQLQPVQLMKSLYSLIQQALFFMFVFFLFTYSKTFANLFHSRANIGQFVLVIILFSLM